MKIDILAIGVHPDDIELSACGTLFRHIDLGYSVGLCDLTQGELGTRGSAEIRLQESKAVEIFIGAKFRENLGMKDGFFEYSEENLFKIIRVVRKHKPEIVLANAVSDRHPDHGRAAKLVQEACFYSGLVKIVCSDEKGNDLEAWRPKSIYHYIQDRNIKADFVVDISPYIDKKIETILKYKSQFFNPDSNEPNTPISSQMFLDFIKAKNKSYGRDIGVEFAEAFNVSRDIGVNNLFDLI
jgi:bacillithiol biosynthesis deacetylase BshB1